MTAIENGTFERKLSAQELAEIFGVTHVTIHRWVSVHGLPHHRTIGRRLRFSPAEVRCFLLDNGFDVPPELAHLATSRRRHRG